MGEVSGGDSSSHQRGSSGWSATLPSPVQGTETPPQLDLFRLFSCILCTFKISCILIVKLKEKGFPTDSSHEILHTDPVSCCALAGVLAYPLWWAHICASAERPLLPRCHPNLQDLPATADALLGPGGDDLLRKGKTTAIIDAGEEAQATAHRSKGGGGGGGVTAALLRDLPLGKGGHLSTWHW